jgi:hypothetical protein
MANVNFNPENTQRHEIQNLNRTINQKGGEDDNCCGDIAKIVVLAVAIFAAVALFSFLTPIPAIIATALILSGCSYVFVPVHPSHVPVRTWRNTTYLPTSTFRTATLPSHTHRTTTYSSSRNTSFGSAFGNSAPSFAAPSRSTFGSSASFAAPRSGGNVAFGGRR